MGYNELETHMLSHSYKVSDEKRKQKVCIHWLRNACKKGDKCDFLHKYDMAKMPICKFIQQNGVCHKQENCVYRHPKPEEGPELKKTERCPYYDKGFCKLGNNLDTGPCIFWHDDSFKICQNYMLGFCPEGPNCPHAHVRYSINPMLLSLMELGKHPKEEDWVDRFNIFAKQHQAIQRPYDQLIICHRCGEEGHKSTFCQEEKISEE